MKNAYVALQEFVTDPATGAVLGSRVVQVADTRDGLVDVPGVLIWVDCADDTVANLCYYDTTTQEIKLIPVPVPPEQPIGTGLQTL